MATNKLLKPTNVTIAIPAFTDQPDQRVNSNCIDKEADAINALNDQIANIKVAQNLGTFGTIDAIQTAIVTEIGTMSDFEIRNKNMSVSTASGVFVTTAYVLEITRFSSTRCFVKAYRGNSTSVNYGNYTNGSWAWT